MNNRYDVFLKNKTIQYEAHGIDAKVENKQLFPFQRQIVEWALKKGRSAIFADCGLGKTLMQLEWAAYVSRIEGPVLILAPLAVTTQTVEEGKKFGIDCYYERIHPKKIRGITVTNYEMIDHFDVSQFKGVVLDESSILKSYDGKTRTKLIDLFKSTPYRLACTATPAPNDHMELGNHAEFLGVLTRSEMLSTFFVHDGAETQKWRLKGHAESDFWKWLCSWAVSIRHPSDLGDYQSEKTFILPKMEIIERTTKITKAPEGMLFALPASTLSERIIARRESVADRVKLATELIKAAPSENWICWCDLNKEADAIEKLIPGSVQIKGSNSQALKEKNLLGFTHGKFNVLITKPSIAGFGLNWQHCSNVIFIGLSDSYEAFYQAVRRCWRFGQKKDVKVYVVTGSLEGAVVSNIKRKEEDSIKMAKEMNKHMTETIGGKLDATTLTKTRYKTKEDSGKRFDALLGDCVERVKEIESGTIDYSIFSPPFASLYTYSASDRDMGNSKSHAEFYEHFGYLVPELLRVTKPGRLLSFHCMNLPTSKSHDGFIGLRDFRGLLIKIFEDKGWIYHSEVCIWKDPVTAMQRTKALGLLHKQLKKDSCMSRQGIADYLVTMRKPGDNPDRVSHTNESFPVQLWQKYASPVWMDINPSNTLQFRSAREHKDERHICPLQLEVIERAIKLWTNPRDLVLSPFMGIGSEGHVALSMGRRFVGIELKESYYKQAVKNLHAAESVETTGLFSIIETTVSTPV